MFKTKQQNTTFQISIDASRAIEEIAKNSATASLIGMSKDSLGKEPKDWASRDKKTFREAARKTYLSLTYLGSDQVFFVRPRTVSYMALLGNKELLFSEELGDSASAQNIDFRVYSRMVDGIWCLTAGLYAIATDELGSGELRILADWPMFETQDEVYEHFGFKIDRDESIFSVPDDFGEEKHFIRVNYARNGVSFYTRF